ncbi:MAG: energy-coupling factor ABC transporter ATP-binding protein [Methanophagales archaeon ANME-1-THS]|nr:MAG: energy-coupling factor ABC transporter ATP-binding protein [Methanophagales archaeon ANME-1-THS]
MVEVQDLWFSYDKKRWVLKGIDMELRRGEKTVLVGSNGSGKTTLFLHLNGLLVPDKGTIKVSGNFLSYTKKALTEVRKRVGIVFQNPDDQIVAPIVFQDVALGPVNLGLSEGEVKKRVKRALNELNIEELRDRKVHELSEGEKKKVAIAGVLAMEPELLVLDEPMSGLDPQSSKDLLTIIDSLCEQNDNMAVLVATHDVELAYEWADRVMVMRDGEIVKSGKPYDVLGDEEVIKSSRLAMPRVLRIYKGIEMAACGNPGVPPRNIEELLKVMRGNYWNARRRMGL